MKRFSPESLSIILLCIILLHMSSSFATECVIKGDSNPCDGIVSDFEILNYIDQWVHAAVSDFDLLEAIDNWAYPATTTITTTTTIAFTTTTSLISINTSTTSSTISTTSTSSTTTSSSTSSTTTSSSTSSTTTSSSTSSTTTMGTDECGNDVGNGYEIISGPSEPTEYDPDNPFRSLTIHPDNENIILIGTERNGFVRSLDGGQSWTRLRNGLRHYDEQYAEIYDISYSGNDPDVIYAATLNGPGPITGQYPSSHGGVYKSVDGGENWTRKNCGFDNGCVESIHVNPENPDKVVIGIRGGATSFSWGDIEPGDFYPGGIYRTENGGENWTKADIILQDNNNSYRSIIAAASNSSLLFTFGYNMEDPSSNVGFLKSTDGGVSWSQFAPEMKEYIVRYFDVSSDGSIIYVVSDVYKIFKSVDGGQTWSEYWIGTSGYAMDVSPDDPNRILFSKLTGLYLSTDGLNTENQVIDIMGAISDVVFAPSNGSVVYAITEGYDVYKSIDEGQSFSKIVNLREEVLNIIP